MKTVGETVILSRQELYDLVWGEPMRILAQRFGISDVALAKKCRKHHIPHPTVGYWAKKANGRQVWQVKLSKNTNPVLQDIEVRRSPPPLPKTEPEPLPLEIQRELTLEEFEERRIHVAEDTRRIHPMVRALKGSMPRHADGCEVCDLHTAEMNNVKTSRQNLDRSLRIMDALLRAFKTRKYGIAKNSQGKTCVSVNGEEVAFDLVERLRREPFDKSRHRKGRLSYRLFLGEPKFVFVASGKLAIRVHDRWQWKVVIQDNDDRKIEDRLNEFFIYLIVRSHELKKQRAAEEERARLRRIREAEEAERRRLWEEKRQVRLGLIRAEEQRLKTLLQDVRNWEESTRLRAFINGVQSRLTSDDQRQGMPLPEWLEWARSHADRLDPLVESPASILDEKSEWEKT